MQKFQSQVYKINDILGWHERRELQLSPKFQRRPVWSPQGKSYLIDSIIKGFPLPQFFIREKVLTKERKTVREVVDGQQRLTAILDFIDEKFTIATIHNRTYGKTRFSDLPEEIQESFLSFPLAVNVLIGTNDPDVLEIFSRLNSYSVPLNNQEKLNAQYLGVFKQKMDELSRTHLAFWEKNEILTEQQMARMREVELTAELVGAMLEGLQNGKTIINVLYKDYDNEFLQYAYIRSRFAETLELCEEFLDHNIAKLKFKRPPVFYSLFSTIYDLRYGFGSEDANPSKVLNRDELESAKQKLYEVNQALDGEDGFEKYKAFVDASKSATDSSNNRQIRHSILKDILANCFING